MRPSRTGRPGLVGLLVVVQALWVHGLAGQAPPRINGRVVNEAGDPVAEATVTLTYRAAPDSIQHTVVTNPLGLFQVGRTRSGEYDLTVEHIAYGSFTDDVTLMRGERLALRVRLSTTAIELRPVVVEGVRDETQEGRARGTAQRILTSEELGRVADTGAPLVVAMSQLLPGVSLTAQRRTPGQMLCLQLRSPFAASGGGCFPPMVIVDGVRQANSIITLNTMSSTDIRRLEVIPPGEAGVQYGTDSRFGVVLIETFAGQSFRTANGSATAPRGVYDWSLETNPYPWGKTAAIATAANAVGMLAGYALSKSCLQFDDLTSHFYEAECGFLANTGARAALYVAPHIGVGYVVERLGGTDLSQGSMWRSAVASSILSIPGVILSITNDVDGFSGSRSLGAIFLSLGAPLAAVTADRLFRRVHP